MNRNLQNWLEFFFCLSFVYIPPLLEFQSEKTRKTVDFAYCKEILPLLEFQKKGKTEVLEYWGITKLSLLDDFY